MAADELGPWRGGALRDTALNFNGDGSDQDLPDPLRFARGVGRLILRRRRLVGDALRRDAISVFLLKPEGPAGRTSREPTLGDGDVEVAGRLWFVGPTAQSGRFIEPTSPEPSSVFEQVQAMGLEEVPAVIFNPRPNPPSLRYYPKGIEQTDEFEDIQLGGEPVTPQRIEAIVDRMWEHSFITPDAQIDAGSGVWENAPQLWAKTGAEAIVQAHLKTALAVALIDCVVRHEQPTNIGRVDLEIEQRTGTGWTRHVEIEVKVLRERGSTGKPKSDQFNQRWIRRGIRQAAAYRDDRGASHGVLCCFDMRSIDRNDQYCTIGNSNFAQQCDVRLIRRFLYNDSEAWRRARYGI